jgi:hypothetical protein
MTDFSERLGWMLYLMIVMSFVTNTVTSLVKLVWDESAEGKVVDGTDALFVVGKTFACWIKHMTSNRLASGCSISVFILMPIYESVSLYASLGYSSIVYAISGILTPYLIRRIFPPATVFTAQVSPSAQTTEF